MPLPASVPLTNKQTAAILTATRTSRDHQDTQTCPTSPLPPNQPTLRHTSTIPTSQTTDTAIEEDIDTHLDETQPPRTNAQRPQPKQTNSLHARYFTHSALPKAFQVERDQPFGKNNVNQSFTSDKSFLHIAFIVLKSEFLTHREHGRVRKTCKSLKRLWQTWERVEHLQPADFRPLLEPNPHWNEQTRIDKQRVDLRAALLLHFDNDLPTLHRFLGGNHTAEHMDPDVILPRVKNILDTDTYNHLERILRFGCPAYYNAHGTRENYIKYRQYGNHASLEQNEKRALTLMNKEDKRDFVLTLPAWMTDLIPNLQTNPQALRMIVGKNDRLIHDSSFMVDEDSTPYNSRCEPELEPDIFFDTAWERHLTSIYNLRISFPDQDILLMDTDITAAFRWAKYNPNVIPAKAFEIANYLFVCTGQNFGDTPSPANFEPFAQARTALGRRFSRGDIEIPHYSEHLDALEFDSPPPPGTAFTPARPDKYNKGVSDEPGGTFQQTFNMYVDDELIATVGKDNMLWLIRCSLHAAYSILGTPDPTRRPDPVDFDKLTRAVISAHRTQLGIHLNTRTLTVSITDEKRADMLDTLRNKWGPRRRSFTLRESAELLGQLHSHCRTCRWGIFLFTNILKAMVNMLSKNARRLMNTREYQYLVEQSSRHPTDSSQYRYFSSKTARSIYNAKAVTFIDSTIRTELDFITHVLSNPDTYNWSAPIAHLIKREPDCEAWQDACLTGGGGFSLNYKFWWALEWPETIVRRTIRYLKKGDRSLISINLLEYVAIIISLAGTILTWEALPPDSRPVHPVALLWTDNTSAASWTKRIAGLQGPQGKSLARIFAHLLMFSEIGVNATHIDGDLNPIADFLSRIREHDDFSQFTRSSLIQKFPQLKHCHHFHPSQELLSLLTSALSTGSANIPITRVELGHMTAE